MVPLVLRGVSDGRARMYGGQTHVWMVLVVVMEVGEARAVGTVSEAT